MDTLKSLQKIWKHSLSAKYGYGDEKNQALVDDSIKVLSNIFLKFNNSPYSDQKFSRQIINGNDKQYEQALSEMLFFDILERQNFKLLPTPNEGPDFHALKNNFNIMCEVIAPKPDNEGITEWHNNDLETRIGAGARRTKDQDREIFLKITSALKTKQEKFQTDKEKGLIPPNAACVVVINDALFLPEDIPMFGVSHSANWGEAPYIARATLNGAFTLLTKNLKPIYINGFLNTSLDHISAIIQVTLRDDYGHRICLIDELNEQFCRLAGFTNDYDIVLNNNAKIKLPNNIFKMDHWHLNTQGNFICDKVPKQPSLHDIARHHNLQRKFFGLPEIDEEKIIFALNSGNALW
ncbi:hypothetical protein [Pseudomonas siliginis]|uniref:hypothetical protein n=1 Tax=Pseudomonas siliginis TaxID=2842346 RepID=UPI0020926A99|nr:hypothetical protein [Pseudomonas siliginis]UST93744.1 hypothetical protein NF679_17275 [Pseudomonas siliginis]